MTIERAAESEAAMEALGAGLAPRLHPGLVVFLHGPLGAGKTTLVRGVLRALGHGDSVRSPTYTLVESYPLAAFTLHHFDLYRLNDPEELEFLGVRDYLGGHGVCLIEWAERGAGVLPVPDVDIIIEPSGAGRRVRLTARTDNGRALVRDLP